MVNFIFLLSFRKVMKTHNRLMKIPIQSLSFRTKILHILQDCLINIFANSKILNYMSQWLILNSVFYPSKGPELVVNQLMLDILLFLRKSFKMSIQSIICDINRNLPRVSNNFQQLVRYWLYHNDGWSLSKIGLSNLVNFFNCY